VPLGRNHARPSRTVRARPACTALARPACAAHDHAGHGPAWPQPAQRAWHTAHGGGTAPVRGKRPRSGGSPVREWRTTARRRRARLRSGRRRGRRGGELSGRRWRTRCGRETGGAGEATVGVTAVRARRSGDGRRGRGSRCRAGAARRALSGGAGERGGCRGARRVVGVQN
jgi:hypothetical protein